MVVNINRAPIKCLAVLAMVMIFSAVGWASQAKTLDQLFESENLTASDSILITQVQGTGHNKVLYQWQADKPLVPASLAKLATSYLAIKKWGLEKHFETQFYRHGSTLWVKGFGDPYLVSEEIDLIVKGLNQVGMKWVRSIAIDGSYFNDQFAPGRSRVADPYNAPLAAVSANFNTARLINRGGELHSAEPQTPLTDAAVQSAKQLGRPNKGELERVNLINADNATRNFAQILAAKLNLNGIIIEINKSIVNGAVLIYTHENSHTLEDVIRGILEYSNNFMANQLFLMLADKTKAKFSQASNAVTHQLKSDFGWQRFSLLEGAGLSRSNRFSANQLNDLLTSLISVKQLFRHYDFVESQAQVRAKTGTLNGIRSLAGYIEFDEQEYQFVFNFNRRVSYKYREALLKKLVDNLSK